MYTKTRLIGLFIILGLLTTAALDTTASAAPRRSLRARRDAVHRGAEAARDKISTLAKAAKSQRVKLTAAQQALQDAPEGWKWRALPVWYSDGMIRTGETDKSVVKLTFANGAELDDPSGLFNSSLAGNVRREIDIYDAEKI